LANYRYNYWPVLVLSAGQDRVAGRLELMAGGLAEAADQWRAAKEAVDAAKAEVKASQDRLRAARTDLNAALVAEARAGTRMRDLVAATGLSREWIRTVLRQNGVLADD
jgi:hypothetical protein